jgi:hypothetical protein
MKRVPTPKESEIRAEVAQIQANRLESFFRQSFERIRTKIDRSEPEKPPASIPQPVEIVAVTPQVNLSQPIIQMQRIASSGARGLSNGASEMNRDSIVDHIKARDRVIAWTASNLYYRYWLYRPSTERVDYVCLTTAVPDAIRKVAEQEGTQGGIWVRGLAGLAGLFPMFGEPSRHYCNHCEDFHDSDDTAEWMLLAKVDRAITQSEFRELPMRLTHPQIQEMYASQTQNTHIPLARRMTESQRLGDLWAAWNDWNAKHPRF